MTNPLDPKPSPTLPHTSVNLCGENYLIQKIAQPYVEEFKETSTEESEKRTAFIQQQVSSIQTTVKSMRDLNCSCDDISKKITEWGAQLDTSYAKFCKTTETFEQKSLLQKKSLQITGNKIKQAELSTPRVCKVQSIATLKKGIQNL